MLTFSPNFYTTHNLATTGAALRNFVGMFHSLNRLHLARKKIKEI